MPVMRGRREPRATEEVKTFFFLITYLINKKKIKPNILMSILRREIKAKPRER